MKKIDKRKICVLENVNMKPYAKFQESHSIRNTQTSTRTIHNANISKSKNWKTDKKKRMNTNSSKHFSQTIQGHSQIFQGR